MAILMLLVLAFAVTTIQFYYLNKSQSQAIRESVPALAESHRLESLMAELLLFQSEIRSATSPEDTMAIANELESLNTRIVNSHNTIAVSNTSRALSGINNELNQVKLAYFPLLDVKAELNQGIQDLSEKRDELSALGIQFLEFAEPELVETQTALYKMLHANEIVSATISDNTEYGNVNNEISRLVTIQNVLSELSFRFLTVVEESIQLSRNTSGKAPNNVVSQIALNLKIATQLLTSLVNNDVRRELAQKIRQLRQLIVASDGVIQLLEKNNGFREKLDSAQEQQARKIILLSATIDDIVGDTRDKISDSSNIFERTLLLTSLFLFSVGSLILGVVLLVNYFVIEKQINRRISLLTEAVLDIAKGDSTRSVSIAGNDEIGKMASSLSVFKDTALQLRSSNEELEQFAYAAAHDLRSPLIAIENLATWTIEDDGKHLPESCLSNLQLIVKRAKRLSALQNDLLEYSRAGHAENPVGEIRLDRLMDDIAELSGNQQEFPVKYSGYMLPVRTYVAPLRQVLINLINNSKKHHDEDTGVIKVTGVLEGSRLTISVHDDGPGIAPRYQKKIFELFNTLKSRDKVEGSGLGLALVNKLVAKHHGTIQVRSNPSLERGTRFDITWPVF